VAGWPGVKYIYLPPTFDEKRQWRGGESIAVRGTMAILRSMAIDILDQWPSINGYCPSTAYPSPLALALTFLSHPHFHSPRS
jgi:hypothetical protein